MSQPAVTKIIQSLEAQLGCELMIRSKKGIELTPDGLRFFNMIAPSCEGLISVEQAIKDGRLNTSEIAISINPPLFDKITKVLLAYRKKYPNINIHIDADEPEMKRQYLKNKSRDIILELDGVIDQEKRLLDGWTTTTVYGVPLRAYAGESLAQLLPDPISLEDLLTYPLLYLGREKRWDSLRGKLGDDFDTMISRAQVSANLSVQKFLAAMNEGILLTTDIAESENLSAIGLVCLDVIDPLPVSNIVMYALEDNRLSEPALAFKNLLLKMMPGMAPK